MHNTLSLVAEAEIRELEVLDILFQRLALHPRILFFDKVAHALKILSWRRWDIVISGGKSAVCSSNFAASIVQTFKSLRRCHFVDEVAVDIEQYRAIILFIDYVALEDLVVPSSTLA